MTTEERAELRKLIDARKRRKLAEDAFFSHRGRTGTRDHYVVPTTELHRLVDGFVKDWERRNPEVSAGSFTSGGKHTRDGVSTVSAVNWLAEESGVSPHTIQNVLGRKDAATGQRKPRTANTELHVADALVAALGCPQALHDGTLTVRENPQASRDALAAAQSDRQTFARERVAERRAEQKHPGQMSLTGHAAWPYSF